MSFTGEEITYCPLAHLPRSRVRQRSLQKGKSGSALVTGFLQIGQRSLVRLGIQGTVQGNDLTSWAATMWGGSSRLRKHPFNKGTGAQVRPPGISDEANLTARRVPQPSAFSAEAGVVTRSSEDERSERHPKRFSPQGMGGDYSGEEGFSVAEENPQPPQKARKAGAPAFVNVNLLSDHPCHHVVLVRLGDLTAVELAELRFHFFGEVVDQHLAVDFGGLHGGAAFEQQVGFLGGAFEQ
jgi:hypothetical protein